ncbi:FAD-linked oxidoreductase [Fulvia fulva]|uniref:FAD-linked oxidoreductase n=1 Tax=Passalora fulva TaxID=5499 RepID=UPI002852A617|nr:FAD-linked oxidoreductase [Fulvia fulva]WMI38875.1 FAD-linked oxidoreductase [Fulvia fulva]
MKWAADRDVRIVVKGTGHDLSGRSSGAFGLSIWTRWFRTLRREKSWNVPGQIGAEDVFVVGSGLVWGDILEFAMDQGRVVTTGQDPSVGLGGYVQGGGHGPLASTVGLASQQVLQVTIVTTTGEILIANEVENEDLFWAIRGGGGGQYGVVTEYVIHARECQDNNNTAASWDAAAYLIRKLPDLMDAGPAGAATLSSGETAMKFNPSLTSGTDGAVLTQIFWSFNTTTEKVNDLIHPILAHLQAYDPSNTTLSVTWSPSPPATCKEFYTSISRSNTAGSGGVSSSRLLGRNETSIPHEKLVQYVRRAVASQNATAGTYAIIGLSGGPGVQNADESRWGALLPFWRSAYLHVYVGGASASLNGTNTPQDVLDESPAWMEENKETLWREWAPEMGAYMNEANPYDSEFARDFYGDYDGLKEVKERWDPTSSLYVVSGVGSEEWRYGLEDGRLCRGCG